MLFRLSSHKNKLAQLPKRRFDEMLLSEKSHLQEWIAQDPEMLGEELLVIQKEFDGFNDTRERLDLLAVDKNGCLVIIENKLDDSGRDMVWQCLKYVAYCSSLTKHEVVDVYQRYLDQQGQQESAAENLCDFLNSDDLSDIQINTSRSQRMILVAAKFRKEVTSAVLWMCAKQINVKCIQVTPYQLSQQSPQKPIMLMMFQQIIPPPEAEDYMIKMSTKEIEEEEIKRVQSERDKLRLKFWSQLLHEFPQMGNTLFSKQRPSHYHRLTKGSECSGCQYVLIFNSTQIRVELFICHHLGQKINKLVFDELEKNKAAIEQGFGHRLKWYRLSDKKASRISYGLNWDTSQEQSWSEAISWFDQNINRFISCLNEPLIKISEKLKNFDEPISDDEDSSEEFNYAFSA